ncbi:unnamed protein product [Adineta steineri]|uniref:DH domain-containing protein n=1 Tax=Adineta steineri TaxID=433720 RepID=A0A814GP11_9BILA|nr:unnamed protein product [Adineta steineri]CAF3871485.1 unnamed protein product [Adineta steineri]
MKFWCGSSRRKSIVKSNNSLSSSASYETISSLPIQKSDSGFSETSSSIIQSHTSFEQILIIEKTHHENLKKYIIKYSRPLRRYFNPTEIVNLFQNIEKISTISKSIVHQCDKLLREHSISHIPISMIYQSSFGVMIDSYNTYISRNIASQRTLKQYSEKIAYFLQIPIEVVEQEITDFILLPLRHICILNDVFQNYDLTNMIEAINFLSNQASCILRLSSNDQESISNLSLESDIQPIIVLQRTDKESWKSKQLELSKSRLLFTELNESSVSTSICLSNVVHIEEDFANEKLCLLIASNRRTSEQHSLTVIKRVYLRFENRNEYCIWLYYLRNAIQDAKDQNWTKRNELFI